MKVDTVTTLSLSKEEISILENANDLLGRIVDEMYESSEIEGYDYDDIENMRSMFVEIIRGAVVEDEA